MPKTSPNVPSHIQEDQVLVLRNMVQAAWLMSNPQYLSALPYLGCRPALGVESYEFVFADKEGRGALIMATYDYGRARVFLAEFRNATRRLHDEMATIRLALRRQAVKPPDPVNAVVREARRDR